MAVVSACALAYQQADPHGLCPINAVPRYHVATMRIRDTLM